MSSPNEESNFNHHNIENNENNENIENNNENIDEDEHNCLSPIPRNIVGARRPSFTGSVENSKALVDALSDR